MKKTIIAFFLLTGCTTVGQSIAHYQQPTVKCRANNAGPIEQIGLPPPPESTQKTEKTDGNS